MIRPLRSHRGEFDPLVLFHDMGHNGLVRRIAVIIPVFNRRRLIVETLRSVAAQTVKPDRIIVFDDASTDGSAAAVADWIATQADGSRYELIASDRNVGPCHARNRAFEHVDCDLVAFLDSDDRWPADFLERTSLALRQNPGAVAATTDIETHRARGRHLRRLHRLPKATKRMIFEDAGLASASLLAAAPVRATGGFEPSFLSGHDSVLFLALAQTGPWLHVPGAPIQKFELPAAEGAEGRLSTQFRNPYRQWALAHERIVERAPLIEGISKAQLRRWMAARWYRAGRWERRMGRRLRAAAAFHRAVRWSPLHLRARRDAWRSRMTGKHARPAGAPPKPTRARA